MLSESVKKQSKQIFQNIKILFDSIPEEEFKTIKGGFPTWKHFYHLIHSIDKNFINPNSFQEPTFHQKNMDIIYMESGKKLSKKELEKYYQQVKSKIQKYFNSLTDSTLEEVVSYKELKLTKMELILAQFRHIFYHVGYLHCCIKIEKGQTPEYIGIYKSIPEK